MKHSKITEVGGHQAEVKQGTDYGDGGRLKDKVLNRKQGLAKKSIQKRIKGGAVVHTKLGKDEKSGRENGKRGREKGKARKEGPGNEVARYIATAEQRKKGEGTGGGLWGDTVGTASLSDVKKRGGRGGPGVTNRVRLLFRSSDSKWNSGKKDGVKFRS